MLPLSDSVKYSGSLVFFAGNGFSSRAIALRTCSWRQLWDRQWLSHVGFTIDYAKQTMLIESTTFNTTPCYIQNKMIKGVQAHPLEERVAEYPGRVWIARPNIEGLRPTFLRNRAAELRQAALSKLGEPYDLIGAITSGTEIIKHWYGFSPDKFFCSELTAWALNEVQMSPVKKREVAGLVTPAELARDIEYGDEYEDLHEITLYPVVLTSGL